MPGFPRESVNASRQIPSPYLGKRKHRARDGVERKHLPAKSHLSLLGTLLTFKQCYPFTVLSIHCLVTSLTLVLPFRPWWPTEDPQIWKEMVPWPLHHLPCIICAHITVFLPDWTRSLWPGVTFDSFLYNPRGLTHLSNWLARTPCFTDDTERLSALPRVKVILQVAEPGFKPWYKADTETLSSIQQE